MVPQKIKEHPIKSGLAILISLITIVSFMFRVDARYAKAGSIDDVNDTIIDVQEQIDEQKTDIVNELLTEQYQMQIENIEDDVFEIDTKIQNNTATPTDRAMKSRKIRKMGRISDKINALK